MTFPSLHLRYSIQCCCSIAAAGRFLEQPLFPAEASEANADEEAADELPPETPAEEDEADEEGVVDDLTDMVRAKLVLFNFL